MYYQGHYTIKDNLRESIFFVPQSYETTAKWYKLAAEQGNLRAQSMLSLMYQNGKGVPKSFKTIATFGLKICVILRNPTQLFNIKFIPYNQIDKVHKWLNLVPLEKYVILTHNLKVVGSNPTPTTK